jgi:type I restriction enzyme S subunit
MTEWQVRRLGELCNLRRDQVPPDRLKNEQYVAMEHLDSGRASLQRWAVTDGVRSNKGRFQKGDILYGKLRPYLDKAVVAPFDGVCSTELLVLDPDPDRVDPKFLCYLIHTAEFRAFAEATTAGVNHPRTSWSSLAAFEALIPTTAEQVAIASALDVVEAAIRTEELLFRSIDRLKSATMAKLFREGLRGEPLKQTEIGEIPESWEVVRLGDIAKIGNGSTPKRTNEAYWEGGHIPWITSTKIHEVIISRADEFVTETAFRECHLPLVPRKSIVVAITGQGKTLGNAALLELDTCINQHLAYVQLQASSAVPEFYLFYLQSLYPYFRQVSSSGGSTKGALTCALIANLKAPSPCKEEQQEIADVLMLLTRRHKVATKRFEALTNLFGAVLPQLMTGAIRVKDLDLAEVSHA